LRLTRLGLGGAPLGGLFTSVSEEDASEAVVSAWDGGVRYFDTAPFYGHGTSELRLGAVLRERERNDYVISSKVGRVLVPAENGAIEDHKYRDVLEYNPVFDFSHDGVMRSFESSLERLGIERIDILFVHDPDDHFEMVLKEAFPTLARLREEGVVKAIGAGMNQWQMLYDFARQADFECFLLAGRYTLLDQSALDKLLPECEARGIGVIVGGPYNSGVLAGSRARGHYDYEMPPPEVVSKVESLEKIAKRHDVPLKAAALQFPMAHPAVVSVIPGARSGAEVRDNVAMFEREIPDAFWHDLVSENLVESGAPLPVA
jgi:D-threo-aldose 1-dehydrogenase